MFTVTNYQFFFATYNINKNNYITSPSIETKRTIIFESNKHM